MGFIIDMVRNRHKQDPNALTQRELINYHVYANDLLADGFVSPIMLPCDRLKSLKGSMSISEMADRCHIPTREMGILLNTDYLEPNPRQLMSISHAFGVSVFWLLGYHTDKASFYGDREILQVISRRNAAEANAAELKEKGLIRDILEHITSARIRKYVLAVAATAARLTEAEHLPLAETDLRILKGQPVFVEYTDEDGEWGIVTQDGIITSDSHLCFDGLGLSYSAFLTPRFA